MATDTSSTWDGITINFDNLMGGGGYDWYNQFLTVGGSDYRLMHGYMVAGLREMDTKLTSAATISAAAGSALPVIKYGWDAGTTDADPGTGEVRANNATLASATTLYLSTSDTNSVSVSAIVDVYDDSTSTTKGYLAIGHRTDPTKWVMYAVSGSVVTATGYRKVTVTYVAGPGGFSAGDPVALGFVRTGDKGDTGATGSLSGGNLTGALNETAVTIASASTTDIGAAAGNAVRVTGTTTITALGTVQSGARRTLTFGGALTLTHNATSLILPGAANITTAAGDVADMESLGSGNWRCVGYLRAAGITGSGLSFSTVVTKTGAYTVTTADAGSLILASGTWTLALPAAASAGNGFSVVLKNTSSGTITVDPTGSETINGNTTVVIPRGASAILVCGGTGWQAIGIPATDASWTWDPTQIGTGLTLSSGNAVVSSTDYGSVLGVTAISGAKYFELTDTSAGTGGRAAAICVVGATLTHASIAINVRGYVYNSNGTKANNSTATSYGSTWTTGDVIGVAVNAFLNMIWFSKNGVWQGGGDPAAGTNPTFTIQSGYTYYPACYLDGTTGGASMRINSGLNYAPPTGFTPL